MISNILVLTAFQEGSQRALSMAAEVAQRFQGRVHVLHVIDEDLVEVISTAMVPGTEPGGALGTASSVLPAGLGRQIPQPSWGTSAPTGSPAADGARRAKHAGLRGPTRSQRAVDDRGPHRQALHGHHGDRDRPAHRPGGHGAEQVTRLKEFLLGSIADKVVRTVACPVCLCSRPIPTEGRQIRRVWLMVDGCMVDGSEYASSHPPSTIDH